MRMKIKLLLAILIVGAGFSRLAAQNVTLLLPAEPGKGKPVAEPGWLSATSLKDIKATTLSFQALAEDPGKLKDAGILWFHKTDTLPFTAAETDPMVIKAIKTFLKEGGKLFLTNGAFAYINVLGLEPEIPKDSIKSCIDEGYGRKLGFHAFKEHPLFDGMNGGAYVLVPEKDQKVHVLGYFGEQSPKNGKVVAVDWDYIFLRENSKVIVEYAYGKGKVLAVGGYIDLVQSNRNNLQRDRFLQNVFSYLDGKKSGISENYWNIQPGAKDPGNRLSGKGKPVEFPASIAWNIPVTAMDIRAREASPNFFDVAGERMLTMGSEPGGIEEVWAHPFMAFRDYSVAIKLMGTDSVIHLSYLKPEIIVNPACFIRLYHFGTNILKEVIVNDPEEPAGVVHYEWQGAPAQLSVTFKSNMRLMWPYAETASYPVVSGLNKNLGAFWISDGSGRLITMAGMNRKPVKYDIQKTAGEADCSATWTLSSTDKIDFVFVGTSEGADAALQQYKKTIHSPYAVYEREATHVSGILGKSLVINTPDPDFNKGYLWAMVATDRFFVNTPGMGKSLVAGYSTTKHGWDGGQKINGRPGYGWYFGRDGQWSGFALLDCGDFTKVRSELEFYNRFQDLNGKIFHEATTSGVIHYDAADATPLYLILAGQYLRHSGDTAFIRKTWPNIKKALDFCFSTDTDRDHLIENTNVGHGWVEGGELYGSHATFYLNGCWAEALKEASEMAKTLGMKDWDGYLSESETVKNVLNTAFWDAKSKFYSYGMNKDRSFRYEPTVLPAVPLAFGLGEPDYAKQVITQYASNEFSTNWGTRIVREDSKLFNPKGYHYGSVWPLFTGWAALAEYRYGNYPQGFFHIMNNLNVWKSWGKGFVEEVLNGSEYKPSGVCAHQCWSETMVLQPAVEGMLGLTVDAQKNKIVLSPRLPVAWDSLRAENIRIRDARFTFTMKRSGNIYSYHFSGINPANVAIEFMPAFPAGTVFKSVKANGRDFAFTSFTNPNFVSLLVSFNLFDAIDITVETEKGIAVLPVVAAPEPGSSSEGPRIIEEKLKGQEYFLTVEGKSGTDAVFQIYIPDQQVGNAENGTVAGRVGAYTAVGVRFEGEGKYIQKTIKLTLK
jgi:glycogen debranching enzyme